MQYREVIGDWRIDADGHVGAEYPRPLHTVARPGPLKCLIFLQVFVFALVWTLSSGAAYAQSRVEEFSYLGRKTQVEIERRGTKDYYQGDIIFNAAKVRQRLRDLESGSSSVPAGAIGTIRSGLAAVVANELWPSARVPFEVEPGLPNQNRITQAIAHWESVTPLRFVRRTTEQDYVRFERDNQNCASQVGKDGGKQVIELAANCSTGSTIHEIGHAVGIFHEQSREDRDQHVVIHRANIKSGKGHNFNKYSENDFLFWGSDEGRDIGPYDFSSIMHYGSFFFSDNGQPTITRRHGCTGNACLIDANRSELSALDRRYIHELYCPMLNWDAARCGKYYGNKGGFAFRISAVGEAPYALDKCLDVAFASGSNHALVNGFECHTQDNQLFYVDRREDGYFTIRAKHSGLCLDVPGGSLGYVQIQQYACHGRDNQMWRLWSGNDVNDKHGRYQIMPKSGNMCLGYGFRDKLVMTDCTSRYARFFTFIAREAPSQWLQIANTQSQECLDVPNATSNVTPLQTFACHTGGHQKWRFLPKADDSFAIEGKAGGKCLTGTTLSGAIGRIDQDQCEGATESVAIKNFYYYLLPDGAAELRTKGRWRQCLTYGGPGRISTNNCVWAATQSWRVH